MLKFINFSIKHTKPSICDLGLEALANLINLVAGAEDHTRDLFYQKYLVLIFDEMLYVMTNSTYISGFHDQVIILSKLFQGIGLMKMLV